MFKERDREKGHVLMALSTPGNDSAERHLTDIIDTGRCINLLVNEVRIPINRHYCRSYTRSAAAWLPKALQTFRKSIQFRLYNQMIQYILANTKKAKLRESMRAMRRLQIPQSASTPICYGVWVVFLVVMLLWGRGEGRQYPPERIPSERDWEAA